MDLSALRARLQGEHHSSPQDCEAIRHAADGISNGLDALARLGHLYHLEPGPPVPGEIWPRLMFHAEAAPNGRLVASPYEAYELGTGWFFTLAEAQHAEGMRAQFAGRGGIGDRSVPMLLNGAVGPQAEPAEPHRNDNAATIAAWKAAHNGHNDTSQQQQQQEPNQ